MGVFRAIRKIGSGDSPSEIEGTALEGLVFQHLQAWIHYTQGHYDLYFWRTKAGLEVDIPQNSRVSRLCGGNLCYVILHQASSFFFLSQRRKLRSN